MNLNLLETIILMVYTSPDTVSGRRTGIASRQGHCHEQPNAQSHQLILCCNKNMLNVKYVTDILSNTREKNSC